MKELKIKDIDNKVIALVLKKQFEISNENVKEKQLASIKKLKDSGLSDKACALMTELVDECKQDGLSYFNNQISLLEKDQISFREFVLSIQENSTKIINKLSEKMTHIMIGETV